MHCIYHSTVCCFILTIADQASCIEVDERLVSFQQHNPIWKSSAKFGWHIFGRQEVLPHLYEVYHRRFRGWRRSWFSLVSSSSWSQVYQVRSEPRLGWWSRKLVYTWELNFGTFGKVTHQSVQDWKWWAAYWRLPQCTRGCIEKSCETG